MAEKRNASPHRFLSQPMTSNRRLFFLGPHTESEIYEDPAVRYEGAAANPDPLDMDSYLVCIK